jgi:hypothetical protein
MRGLTGAHSLEENHNLASQAYNNRTLNLFERKS